MTLALTPALAPAASAAPAPASGGVIHACVLTRGKKSTRGLLRLVPKAKSCKRRKGERPVQWSVSGPSGERGEAGAQGAPGTTASLEKTVTETLTTQAGEIQALRTEIGNLRHELVNLEGGLGSLGNALGSLGTTVTGLSGKVGSLETGVGSLETGLAGVESTVGETCTQLATLTSQSNALGTTINNANALLESVPLLSLLNLPAAPTELTPFVCG